MNCKGIDRTGTGSLFTVLGLCVLGVLVAGSTPAVGQDEPAVQVEIVFGTEVDSTTRRIADPAEVFASDVGSVYCWSRVTGAAAPDTVTHAWYYEGKTMARVDLHIGSANWRTWSSKKVWPSWKGSWEVKVLDRSGTVLAAAGFEVN